MMLSDSQSTTLTQEQSRDAQQNNYLLDQSISRQAPSPRSRPPSPFGEPLLSWDFDDLQLSSSDDEAAPPPPPLPDLFSDRPSPSSVMDLDLNDGTGKPSPSKRKRFTKEVRFAPEALFYPTNLTEEEVKGCWYSCDELAVLKRERKDTVRQLKRVAFDTEKVSAKYCLRGFEAFFSVEMNKATKFARDLVAKIVFCEQNRQRINGLWDTESMRTQSVQASQWARDNALELGTADAQESAMLYTDHMCMGLPYCPHHATCVLISTSAHKKPSRVKMVNQETVAKLESALRVVKEMLAQAYC